MSSSQTPASPSGVLSFENARHLVEEHATKLSPATVDTVDLLPALGRILAEEIVADRDFPPFDRATRDGYAVRSEDVSQIPARLVVVGELKAGAWPDPATYTLRNHDWGSTAAKCRCSGHGGAHVTASRRSRQ